MTFCLVGVTNNSLSDTVGKLFYFQKFNSNGKSNKNLILILFRKLNVRVAIDYIVVSDIES